MEIPPSKNVQDFGQRCCYHGIMVRFQVGSPVADLGALAAHALVTTTVFQASNASTGQTGRRRNESAAVQNEQE